MESINEKKFCKKIASPKEIIKYLDTHVVGQKYAKKVLSVAIHNHYKQNYNNLAPLMLTTNPRSQRIINNGPVYESIAISTTKLLSTTKDSKQDRLKKNNIMLLGPSGSGKTLLMQKLAECLEVPYTFYDCTNFMAGYYKEDVVNIIIHLFECSDYIVDRAEMGIVFLDEVDKTKHIPIEKLQATQIPGEYVQQQLTRMMEGIIVNFTLNGKNYSIDTTNILFIASGTYYDLDAIIAQRKSTKFTKCGVSMGDNSILNDVPRSYENNYTEDMLLEKVEAKDLIRFGMIPSFVRNFNVLVPFHNLNRNMLVKILTELNNSIVSQYQRLFLMNEVELTFDVDALNAIASLAMEKETGARGLQTIMESLLLEPMIEIPKNDIISVHITEQCVKNCEKPHYKTILDDIKWFDFYS